MGTLRGDNGGGERPSDGNGLPDLPPEWGVVVIPDDAAELDHESAQVRRELRRAARRARWRRRLGLRPVRMVARQDTPTLGLPLLIMSVAVIATLTSLFTLAWPGRPAPKETSDRPAVATAATDVPDVTLTDAANQPLRLRDTVPTVVLLVDGCACADLIAGTASAVAGTVTVLAVARSLPALPSIPAGKRVRAAADQDGTLRSTFAGSNSGGGVVVILVNSAGRVVHTIGGVTKVDDFRSDLSSLT